MEVHVKKIMRCHYFYELISGGDGLKCVVS